MATRQIQPRGRGVGARRFRRELGARDDVAAGGTGAPDTGHFQFQRREVAERRETRAAAFAARGESAGSVAGKLVFADARSRTHSARRLSPVVVVDSGGGDWVVLA